jgi:hypothetical protein
MKTTSMPWYMYPDLTCRVMNRIASRTPYEELRARMDAATEKLWDKVDNYYATRGGAA